MVRIISTLALTFLLATCGDPASQRHFVVLHDVTDGDSMQAPLDLLSFLDIDNHEYDHTCITYSQITDTDFNPQIEYCLEAESELNSNRGERLKTIDEFKQNVASIDSREGKELEHSAIWIPLWNTIGEYETKSNSEVTILLLSNLIENDFVNFHDPKDVSRLKHDPESVREVFLSHVPDSIQATHIAVVSIYTPKDKLDNDLHRLILTEIYQPIFKQRGISFEARSNL